jgi:hypothetical protein
MACSLPVREQVDGRSHAGLCRGLSVCTLRLCTMLQAARWWAIKASAPPQQLDLPSFLRALLSGKAFFGSVVSRLPKRVRPGLCKVHACLWLP